MNTLLDDFPWTDLRRFIQSKVRDPQQADDLVQEVAIAVWTKREELRDPGAFKAWVFSIARHKMATSFRSQQIDRTALRRHTETRRTVNDCPETAECHAVVRAALREIPGHFAQVLILRYWYGLSFRDIGTTLDSTAGGVRVLAHRARKALAGQLAALAA